MTLDANTPGRPSNGLALIDQSEARIRLHMEGNRIALKVTAGPNSQAPTTFEAGSLPRILEILVHEPATATELEAAIFEIEEMLMPVIRLLPKHAILEISAPQLRELLNVIGRRADEAVRLEIATVEEVFSRLAAVAWGTPASQLGIPEHRNFAAIVLVLRELMHHAGFASVVPILIRPDSPSRR